MEEHTPKKGGNDKQNKDFQGGHTPNSTLWLKKSETESDANCFSYIFLRFGGINSFTYYSKYTPMRVVFPAYSTRDSKMLLGLLLHHRYPSYIYKYAMCIRSITSLNTALRVN